MRAYLILCVFVVVSWSRAASAQGESALAEALFDAGREAADAGDHATACEKFRESHRLEPGVGTLLNIGECSDKIGDVLAAWQAFNEALKLLENTDKRLPFAKKRFDELDARVAKLTIVLEDGAPEDTVVRRDEVALGAGSFGVPLPVAPGKELVLVVSASGHHDRSFRVTLDEGERSELKVKPGDALPPPAPTPPPAPQIPASAPPSPAPPPPMPSMPPPDEGVNAGDVIGWSAIALGSVAVVTGVALSIDLARRRSDLDDVCNDDVCRRSVEDEVEAFNDRRIASTVSYVVGGVLVATGVILLLAWPDDDPSMAVAPLMGPGFAGMGAHGRF